MATVAERVDRLLTNPEVISTGTRSFLQSIKQFAVHNKRVTDRQEEALIKIEGRFSSESVTKRAQWIEAYNDEQRNIAKICAEYYRRQGSYYLDLAFKVLEEPDFVPTEKQYKAMCENKYAKKIIENTFSEPKYPVGSFVNARANMPYNLRRTALATSPGMIIEAGCGPIITAAKGTKRYKVLPVGAATPVEVEERHIKKAKV